MEEEPVSIRGSSKEKEPRILFTHGPFIKGTPWSRSQAGSQHTIVGEIEISLGSPTCGWEGERHAGAPGVSSHVFANTLLHFHKFCKLIAKPSHY